MDAIHNPYAPGAGDPPPELAGRYALREQVRVVLERLKIGRHGKSIVLAGLRDVGKTVLLQRMRTDAEAAGMYTLEAETPENRSMPDLVIPQLRQVLLRISTTARAHQLGEFMKRIMPGDAWKSE